MLAFLSDEPSSRRARRAGLLALVGFVGLSLLVSAVNGGLAPGRTPLLPFARPATPWLSAACAALLDAAIGVAAWLVWRRIDVAVHRKRRALLLWGWLLLAYAIWPALALGPHRPAVALTASAALLLLTAGTSAAFWPLRRSAAILLLPFLACVAYGATVAAGL